MRRSSSSPSSRGPASQTPTTTGTLAASWRDLPDDPSGPRQEVAAATLNGKIYVIGGILADDSATARVDVYDPQARAWTAAPSLPIGLHHPMAVGFRGHVYVLGGIAQRLGGPDSARVFELIGSRWQDAPSLRHPRGAGAAVVVGDRIIVTGGVNSTGEVGPVEIFDGTSWRDGASMPSPLDHVGAATDGRYVYVAGGRSNGQHFATFQRYDPVTNLWTGMPDMPTARSGLGVAFALGKVIALGGEGPRIFPEVEAFDIEARSWSTLPKMPIPRHGLGTVAVGGTIYTMTGGSRVGVAPSSICEALTLSER